MSEKFELRALLRARRHAHVEALGAGRAIAEAALATFVIDRIGSAQIMSGYLAIGTEVDCLPILAAAHARDVQTALPCIEVEADHLVFRHWTPGEPLMAGPLGIRQPLPSAFAVNPDLIIAPLIGFDRALGRIGQGKGFYDRAFVTHPAARRYGIAWSIQEVDVLPLDAWDVPLHGIATEREWIGD